MQLPRLHDRKDGEALSSSRCAGDKCSECPLYKKRCEGCSQAQRYGHSLVAPNFLDCYQECNVCTGFKVNVPGICCRSPLRDMYLNALTKGAADWNQPTYQYTKRPLLQFKQRAIFYISSGGVNTITAGGKPLAGPEHEVVAVNITRVGGANGFYSQDLKDYLHLSPKTKLVLMTMCLDDLLERIWNREFYADVERFQRVGLDAWMPLSFSAYPEEAHTHQYYQLLRTLYATEKGQAWFTTGDHFLAGVHVNDLILKCLESIPQMVFNTQFAEGARFKYHLVLFKKCHELAPAHVPFWFIGASTPEFMHNTRIVCGTRPLYYLSAKPLYLASKGQQLKVGGGSLKCDTPKWELLQENYRTFAQTVRSYG